MSNERQLRAGETVFVVYAPFGDDPMLTYQPDETATELSQHTLVRSLMTLADFGVHVIALIDRMHRQTYLLDIPGAASAQLTQTSQGKLDMTAPETLTWLLQTASARHPNAKIVLSLEGHGAGFLPFLDAAVVNEALNSASDIEWRISSDGTRPTKRGGGVLPRTRGVLPRTRGVLPQAIGVLPGMPMATYALGLAFKTAIDSGVPKLSVVHFCNCFNLSIEILHTIMPYAEFAAGYPNYNYFTSGETYPTVFAPLKNGGVMTERELATGFAKANGDSLRARTGHPSAGGAIELARMKEISERVDDFADALLHALRSTTGKKRVDVREWIRTSIADAQQYDSSGNFGLESSDQFTDIRGFAMWMINNACDHLSTCNKYPHIIETAQALAFSAVEVIVYADSGSPWMAPQAKFEFDDMRMAMNVLLPDPMLEGVWDWRSPYYLEVNPDPADPKVQVGIIDFLQVTDWVDFIIEYHKGVKFRRFLPRAKPVFPVFNPTFVPPVAGDAPVQSPPDTTQTAKKK